MVLMIQRSSCSRRRARNVEGTSLNSSRVAIPHYWNQDNSRRTITLNETNAFRLQAQNEIDETLKYTPSNGSQVHPNRCHYLPPRFPTSKPSFSFRSNNTWRRETCRACWCCASCVYIAERLCVSIPLLVCCRLVLSSLQSRPRNRLAMGVTSLGVHEQGNNESVKT